MFQNRPAGESLAFAVIVPTSLDWVRRDQQFMDSVQKHGIGDVIQLLAYQK